jgi:hypothetical protein
MSRRFLAMNSRLMLLAGTVLLAAACGSGSSPSAQPTVTSTGSASPSPGSGSGGAGPGNSPTAGGEPGIVAVTTAGALVLLNTSTGSVTQTLVPSGVIGDEVSVSPGASTVYFTEAAGCHAEVESVSISGGDLTAIAPGELPAISPDGTKLAFTSEPPMTQTCVPDPAQASVAAQYKLIIRTISSGAEQELPLPAGVQHSQLLPPISHLSWAADNTRLAVSTSAVADNEGWAVYIVDTATAKYYVGPGTGVSYVPVTGSPAPVRSYIREGIFLPDGDLFISRACCAGVPVLNTSRLMWEVALNGVLVHQVAIGYPNLEHTSLAADPTGKWLLYVGGSELYVSQDGARPSDLASGLIAAAWL